MRWLIVALVAGGSIIPSSCDRKSDFITETQPFRAVSVDTPAGGHDAMAKRAGDFAKSHKMKLHYVAGHFLESEFTISVTQNDLNIITGNVRSGNSTFVTAVARGNPTPRQQAEVDEFMCVVLRECPGGTRRQYAFY